jgi:hypothetical protein
MLTVTMFDIARLVNGILSGILLNGVILGNIMLTVIKSSVVITCVLAPLPIQPDRQPSAIRAKI